MNKLIDDIMMILEITMVQMERQKWILILIIQMMERMSFHIFIFGIGRRNHQDSTVGGKKCMMIV